MKMTNEQIEKILKTVKERPCPNCNSVKEKQIDENLFHLISGNGDDEYLSLQGSVVVANIAISSCADCGYSEFYSLDKIIPKS